MTVDTVHSVIAVVALALLATGAWLAWGGAYAALVIGGLLLSAVIYARTR